MCIEYRNYGHWNLLISNIPKILKYDDNQKLTKFVKFSSKMYVLLSFVIEILLPRLAIETTYYCR